MLKDISRNSISHEIGPISISVDSLLDIIESKNPTKIRAESNKFEFTSIDDIKSHKSLFSGSPRIWIDDVHISFERANLRVSHYGDSDDGASLANSVYKDIISHKNIIDNISELWLFRIYIAMPIILAFTFIPYFYDSKYPRNLLYILISYSLIYFGLHIWKGYSLFFRKPVYYNPKLSFWDRNKDHIWLSVITGVIGIAIGSFSSKLLQFISEMF